MSYSHEEAVAELVETGCDPRPAEVIMRAIDESRKGYITMDELQPLLEAKLDALRKEFGDLKNHFVEISIELKGDLDARFAAGLGELNTRFAELAGALKRDADVRFVEFTGDMNTRFDQFTGNINSRFDQFTGNINSRFDQFTGDINSRFDQFTGNMNTQFAEFKGEVRDELHTGLQDSRQEIQDFRLEVHRGIWKLIAAVIAAVAATIAIIEGLKALFA